MNSGSQSDLAEVNGSVDMLQNQCVAPEDSQLLKWFALPHPMLEVEASLLGISGLDPD